MMIHVKYRNGNYGIVLAQQLEELITSHQISRFLRSSGWAVIGHRPRFSPFRCGFFVPG